VTIILFLYTFVYFNLNSIIVIYINRDSAQTNTHKYRSNILLL